MQVAWASAPHMGFKGLYATPAPLTAVLLAAHLAQVRQQHCIPVGAPTLHPLRLSILLLLTFALALHPLQMVRVPGPHVDVNVHPTKREVSFLFEDRLVEAVCAALQQALTHTTSR